ncbi:hypothetical protein NXT3_PB00026 (plasmid) [Sinorhizobium fredii]|uniref:Uncharacterized protein n=1 Tax=Rhizobium fredii TaxID=380 RepID=A0A2L0HD58_RHIFR|nr:hypothetical protein NXT3_PB00026 [Sinorhizobium fredii]
MSSEGIPIANFAMKAQVESVRTVILPYHRFDAVGYVTVGSRFSNRTFRSEKLKQLLY